MVNIEIILCVDMLGKLLTSGAIPDPPQAGESIPKSSPWVPVYLFLIDTSAASLHSQLLHVRNQKKNIDQKNQTKSENDVCVL
jgi:hypothetical protein